MARRVAVFVGLILCCVSLNAQAPKEAPKKRIAVRAGRLIDGKSEQPIANAMIVVEDGKIVAVTPGGSAPAGVEVIDLSHATVLSGLTDAHTHVLLQGDVTAADYDEQLLKQSIPYRAILAARNAKIALDHGFTTLRDLETEGAMYADVDVKKAINRGEVPGPHMFVSTRAMTPTGMYPLLGYSWEIEVPHGVQFVDGVDNARLAVREQISHGRTGSNITRTALITSALTACCTVT
jgi:imidazolonepropionase-like amidohydrolase